MISCQGEENNQLTIYRDYYFHRTYPIECQHEEINQRIQLLQEWIDMKIENPIDNEKDIFYDCVEQLKDNSDPIEQSTNLIQIPSPWISEICLSVHRNTRAFRRFLNCFHRSRRVSLSNLAEEFFRIHNGNFDHPIGFRFHITHAKEKWILVLKNIKLLNHPTYPYPQTRIIFIRKDVSYIVR